MPPDPDDDGEFGTAIHERMLDGDPVASSELCEQYLPRLERTLASRFPTTDGDLIHDAVIEAVLGYIQHPSRYDPDRRSLFGYLLMAARGDLLNLRERHRGWIAEQSVGDAVELDLLARNSEVAGTDVAESVADELAAAGLREQMMAVAQDDDERIVLRLMLDGERSTTAFVTALGWHDFPSADRRDRLYKLKDRLGQRLRRLRDEVDRDR